MSADNAGGTTKKSRKAAQTREKILLTALQLFQDKGFRETTMRDIAKEADVAVGSAYYYFPSKESLVLAFYEWTHKRLLEKFDEVLSTSLSFRDQVETLLLFEISELQMFQNFASALFREAIDPTSPMSPFALESESLREDSIGIYRTLIEHHEIKVASELQDELPRLFWLYKMGVILFWHYDRSDGQEKTEKLIQSSLDLIMHFIRFSRMNLPIANKFKQKIFSMIDLMRDDEKE